MLGAHGDESGIVFGDITASFRVAHNVRGGEGVNSGSVSINGAAVTIGGSLLGGYGEFSARIVSDGDIGPTKVGHNVIGSGQRSAVIEGGRIFTARVGGSLVGGQSESGSIWARRWSRAREYLWRL